MIGSGKAEIDEVDGSFDVGVTYEDIFGLDVTVNVATNVHWLKVRDLNMHISDDEKEHSFINAYHLVCDHQHSFQRKFSPACLVKCRKRWSK